MRIRPMAGSSVHTLLRKITTTTGRVLSRLEIEEHDYLARVQDPVHRANLGHRDPHDEVKDGGVHPEINGDNVRREAGPVRQCAEERGRHALCEEEDTAGRGKDRERVLSHESSGGGERKAHPPGRKMRKGGARQMRSYHMCKMAQPARKHRHSGKACDAAMPPCL